VAQTASPTSPVKENAVNKLIKTVWKWDNGIEIKTVWIRERGTEVCPESEKVAELVPMKLQKKAGKCHIMEPETVCKTNNVLLKAVVKAHLWKHQLEEERNASVRDEHYS